MMFPGILRVGRCCVLPRGCGSSRLLRSSSAYSAVPTTSSSAAPRATTTTTVFTTAPVSWDQVVAGSISVDEKKANPLDLGRVASPAASSRVTAAANKPVAVRAETVVRRQPHQVAKEVVSPLKAAGIKSTRVQLAGGDLRLGEFIEEVKTELWQYNAMPFRKRFRVQSLLR